MEWVLVALHFPDAMNVFSCAYCPFVDLEKYLFKSFTQFLTVLSLYCLRSSLYIPTQRFANIPPILWVVFSLIAWLATQKFFI